MTRAMGRAEEWRPAPGFEGFYEVSDTGAIRSLYFDPPRTLAPCIERDGYLVIMLYRSGKRSRRYLHRLICEAFHGPPTALHKEAAHLDGGRDNARADNLGWTSKVENEHHKRRHGAHSRGERNGFAKLTPSQVHEIRATGRVFTLAQAAALFGVSPLTIRDIRRRRRWKHI